MLTTFHILITISLLLIMTIILKILNASKTKSNFVKHAQSLGYKVYEYPFKLFGFILYTEYKKQQKLYGDAYHHYKYQLTQYDLVVSNLFFTTMIQILNPQIIKQFYLKANQGYYIKGTFGIGHIKLLMGQKNLLLTNGQQWKNRRKILSNVFNYDFIISQISKIQQIVIEALDRMQKEYIDKQNKQIKCDITQVLNQVFSTVILKCFFKGNQLNQIGQQKTVNFINRLLRQITQESRTKLGIFFGVKLAKLGLFSRNQFRKIAQQIVQKRIKQVRQIQQLKKYQEKQNKKPQDIIDALLRNKQIIVQQNKHQYQDSHQDQHQYQQSSTKSTKSSTNSSISAQKSSMNIDQIINQFIVFFLAGTQTTLSFTRMMIYRLAQNPQILHKIEQQFQKQIKTPTITHQQLKNLKYFQKVQKQVLRMDSSVGAIMTRIVQKDHYLNNLKIYKNTAVNVRIRGIHYKQTQYINPLQFNPQRWNDQNINKNKNIYSYLPFSSGSRNCIGQHLALLENKIFMIQFLRRYKKISINKKFGDIKMLLRSMYGPEKLMTTLVKKDQVQQKIEKE